MQHLFTWDQQQVFLTGATGFIGRELLLRLLTSGVPRIFLLVRGAHEHERREKIEKALAMVIPDPERRREAWSRIRIVEGDISLPSMGISADSWDELTQEVNHVIHCAANVSFAASLQNHLRENLMGTRYSLDLAEAIAARGDLRKYDYVGTAYVAGKRDGLIREDELNERQEFNNSYEHSKFQAELEVLKRTLDLPVTRHRPSVVMGDEFTGRTSNFKMMYWIVKIYADGWWRIVPAQPDAVIDVVPVNFVADSIMAISPQPDSIARAYHIAAGPGLSASIRELALLTEQFFKAGKVVFVPHELYRNYIGPVTRSPLMPAKLRKILNAAKVYEPYFLSTKIFDTINVERALQGTNIACTPVSDYFNRLFEYCLETNWGKNLPNAANTSRKTPYVES